MILKLGTGIRARIHTYALRKCLDYYDAVLALLDAGLRAHESAIKAGQARAATMSHEDRVRAARAGGEATARRWKGKP